MLQMGCIACGTKCVAIEWCVLRLRYSYTAMREEPKTSIGKKTSKTCGIEVAVIAKHVAGVIPVRPSPKPKRMDPIMRSLSMLSLRESRSART